MLVEWEWNSRTHKYNWNKEASKDDFLNNDFDEEVFVHLNTMDYNTRIDGKGK